jgi:MFS family permease
MWGLSMNLCLPYASVYMLALGVSDARIGLLTSAGLAAQMVWGVLAGVITDRIGRRLSVAAFDLVAWSVPCLIWAGASLVDARRGFWLFLGASVLSGARQVAQNAWDCLLVEDAERHQIPQLYSLILVAGNLSALFAPIAALLVAQFSLVPAVRVLYLNAFVVMTAKLVILYAATRETGMGQARKALSQGQPLWAALAGYREVLRVMRRSPGCLFSLFTMVLVAAVTTVRSTFWQVLAAGKLGLPEKLLPFFPMGGSVLAIFFYFTLIPRLPNASHSRTPLAIGFAVCLAGQALLLVAPPSDQAGPGAYLLLAANVALDSFGMAILAMLAEALVALNADEQERARVMAVQRTVVALLIVPSGWLAGQLSSLDRALPFALTGSLLIVGLVASLLRRPTPDRVGAD